MITKENNTNPNAGTFASPTHRLMLRLQKSLHFTTALAL